eukprot:scaffold10563_cov113-Isochrysis_galbana.AAC.1
MAVVPDRSLRPAETLRGVGCGAGSSLISSATSASFTFIVSPPKATPRHNHAIPNLDLHGRGLAAAGPHAAAASPAAPPAHPPAALGRRPPPNLRNLVHGRGSSRLGPRCPGIRDESRQLLSGFSELCLERRLLSRRGRRLPHRLRLGLPPHLVPRRRGLVAERRELRTQHALIGLILLHPLDQSRHVSLSRAECCHRVGQHVLLQPQPPRDGQRVGPARDAPQQPVGRGHSDVVKLDARILKGRVVVLERLERGVVGGAHGERGPVGQPAQHRRAQRRSLGRVCPRANLIQQHQRGLRGAPQDRLDACHVGREGRERLDQRLLVANVGHHYVEPRNAGRRAVDARLAADGPQPRLGHQHGETEVLEGDRLAAGVGPGDHDGADMAWQLVVLRHHARRLRRLSRRRRQQQRMEQARES